jgi:hypothetical protein
MQDIADWLEKLTSLHPIAEWGRERFGGAEVPAEQRLADLESSLTQVKLDPAENTVLLAPLLDIPLPTEGANPLNQERCRDHADRPAILQHQLPRPRETSPSLPACALSICARHSLRGRRRLVVTTPHPNSQGVCKRSRLDRVNSTNA